MTSRGLLALAMGALVAIPMAGVGVPAGEASPGPAPTAAPLAAAARVAPAHPNVVLFLLDDMRTDELQYMPATKKWIGDEGVTFANSFAPNPLCCPARASILSGRSTHGHRVFTSTPWFGFHAFKDRSTLATWLHGGGYRTSYIGKYLNGYGPEPPPGQKSGNSLSYVPPGWTSWRASIDGGLPAGDPENGGTYRYTDTTLSNDGHGFTNYAGRYQTTVYGDLAKRMVRTQSEQQRPFFLNISFTAPHHGGPGEPDDPPRQQRTDGKRYRLVTPARPASVRGMFDDRITESPGRSWDDPDFSDKPPYLKKPALTTEEWQGVRTVSRQRAEALRVADRQVGRVMTQLRDSGELSDTVVMFTSDNGYFLGEQRMRQGKIWPHEPSLRVPLLMRGPGIPHGEVRQDPITSIDVAPTLADAAGVPVGPKVEGLSMVPVARNGDRGWKRAVLTETGPRFGLRRPTDEGGGEITEGEKPDRRFLLGIRTSRYLYVDIASGREELYDLQQDPQEYANVADDPDYRSVRGLLRAELLRMRACKGQDCVAPMDPALQVPAG